MTHSALLIPLKLLPTPHRGRQARLGVEVEANLAAQAAVSRELEEILQAKAEAESVGEARRVAIGSLEETKRGLEMELERAREAQRRGEEERRGVEAMRAQWETRWPVHASHRHVSTKTPPSAPPSYLPRPPRCLHAERDLQTERDHRQALQPNPNSEPNLNHTGRASRRNWPPYAPRRYLPSLIPSHSSLPLLFRGPLTTTIASPSRGSPSSRAKTAPSMPQSRSTRSGSMVWKGRSPDCRRLSAARKRPDASKATRCGVHWRKERGLVESSRRVVRQKPHCVRRCRPRVDRGAHPTLFPSLNRDLAQP